MLYDSAIWVCTVASREVLLFAAVGLLLGGLDDLLVDLIFIARAGWRRMTVYQRHTAATAATLAPADRPSRLAIFIGAWDESGVIGAMLRAALARLDHADYRIYVGVYPNDPATIAAVRNVRAHAPGGWRVRMICGPLAGPTTKAEALNRLWRALLADEARSGVRFKAIVLHDAEDVVHSAELRVFDRLIERFDLVQLPVLPLIVPGSRWVSGHYCDEFAEAHGKQLVVREAIGAGMPSAGVGCALSRDAVQAMADAGGGRPFDDASLTEDYELGLRLADRGGRGIFVRLPSGPRSLVAVRAYFPATIETAVRQKARWMTGIALAGWDRLGWRGGLAERWMRLRDRRALLAAVILAAAYAALLGSVLTIMLCFAAGRAYPVPSPFLAALLTINAVLMLWRAGMRFAMVRAVYGWREGVRAVPRMLMGNIIAMMAARRAVAGYLHGARGGGMAWDKTSHVFPTAIPAE
ncbi:glycosyl transferase family protein [Sphingomonas solaris]|uniref:Glycosyl transferase family protein n=1 Tax=Alterirhizorhabdus solaris TaxID=2529389 RepID=A0A558QWG1_9SPHN|nr:glycosyl transferase family protein [Sphingomonas solaris]TVV71480.1 glycosyl transferase family protein [Sphingomonas solaris]